ncbi:MAG: autotransporter domain-containing protein [Deltaproteobacteria bacterium]|nr:autotransporter domain-containing protein [Deltaproteobacteria bacterium]
MKTSRLTLASLSNFEYLNFYIPASLGDGGTIVTVTTAVDVNGSQVNVGIDGLSSPLREGDTVNLIDADNASITGTPANTTSDGSGMLGVTLRYEFDILIDNQILIATVTKAGVNEQTKSLSEGRLAGVALVIEGADILVESGIRSATDASMGKRSDIFGKFGMDVFSSVSFGDLKYKTGSHINLRSVSFMIGLAKTAQIQSKLLTLGVFFEYGKGSYDTFNSFALLDPVRADGDTDYRGGGVLVRLDFSDNGDRNLYGEFSIRMGRTSNSYTSHDLQDSSGRRAAFDSSSMYYGFHLGAGYLRDITETTSVDIYGRYFWTKVDDDAVTLSTGERVDFGHVNSSRIRLGMKISHEINSHLAAYAGAAFEHEFEGEAGAMTNGFYIPQPKLKGSMAIGELGLSLRPALDGRFSIDLGVQGHIGKRQGVAGSLNFKFSF